MLLVDIIKRTRFQLSFNRQMEHAQPFGHRRSQRCTPHTPRGEAEVALPSISTGSNA